MADSHRPSLPSGNSNEFICQTCNRRLRFEDNDDPSNLEAEVSAYAEFADHDAFKAPDLFAAESFVLVSGHSSPKANKPPNTDENSPPSPTGGLKGELETFKKLMDIANANIPCINPLCENCFSKVQTDLDTQVENVTRDIQKFEQALQEKGIKLDEEEDVPDIPEINEQDEELTRELESILERRKELERQTVEFHKAEKQLSELEDKFLLESNQFWLEIRDMDAEHARVRQRIRSVTEQLDMMKRTNVYDDAFHIYYDGHFGTISGLRLGRLDGQQVEWEEINAALGQAMLLLDVLAARTDFTFERYKLYPMGSVSSIEDTRRKAEHSMYGTKGLFGERGLSEALPCFLDCIRQLTNHARRYDPNFSPKYTIDVKNGKIGDAENSNMVSISPHQSSNEEWTRSLKYMLTNLKFLLAWVARYYPI